MSKENTGGPAFPCQQDQINQNIPSLGMTLRDYFAAKAMQGEFAAQSDSNGVGLFMVDDELTLIRSATLYYQMADAMLKARES